MARLVKTPSVLAREQLAREQSASELMAQGIISFEMTPRQQQAYDDAVRYAAEVDARQREHFEQLPAQIAEENRMVLAQLQEGRLYLANAVGGSTVIHFAACSSIRHQVDRDEAHQTELARRDQIAGSWHSGPGSNDVSKWPNLLTREEVEDLRSYKACQRCNPDTKERRKVAARAQRPSKLSSVGIDRIGREYETVEGEYLGELREISITADRVALRFPVREYSGSPDDEVVLLSRRFG